jgi:hypothetical protein
MRAGMVSVRGVRIWVMRERLRTSAGAVKSVERLRSFGGKLSSPGRAAARTGEARIGLPGGGEPNGQRRAARQARTGDVADQWGGMDAARRSEQRPGCGGGRRSARRRGRASRAWTPAASKAGTEGEARRPRKDASRPQHRKRGRGETAAALPSRGPLALIRDLQSGAGRTPASDAGRTPAELPPRPAKRRHAACVGGDSWRRTARAGEPPSPAAAARAGPSEPE